MGYAIFCRQTRLTTRRQQEADDCAHETPEQRYYNDNAYDFHCDYVFSLNLMKILLYRQSRLSSRQQQDADRRTRETSAER